MTLYKYYSNTKYLLNVIRNSELYFNSFDLFNDPYEKYAVYIDKKNVKNYVDKNVKKNIKVCCFTKTYNNYLMWSHYANSHKGFCIEFDFSGYLKPTKYKNIYSFYFGKYDVLLSPVKYTYYELPININSKRKVFNTMESLRICTHKYKCWKYEKEVRAIIDSDEPKNVFIPHQCIKGVYYGYNISKKMKQKITNEITAIRPDMFQRELVLIPNKGQFTYQ